jgi:hypothetical protein
MNRKVLMKLRTLGARNKILMSNHKSIKLISRVQNIKANVTKTILFALKLICNIFQTKIDLERRPSCGICKVSYQLKNLKYPKTKKLDLIVHFEVLQQLPALGCQEKLYKSKKRLGYQSKTFLISKRRAIRIAPRIWKKVTWIDLS